MKRKWTCHGEPNGNSRLFLARFALFNVFSGEERPLLMNLGSWSISINSSKKYFVGEKDKSSWEVVCESFQNQTLAFILIYQQFSFFKLVWEVQIQFNLSPWRRYRSANCKATTMADVLIRSFSKILSLLVGPNNVAIDNWTFQMFYKVTPMLLGACVILVCTRKDLFG